MTHNELIKWLQEGDVSIRFQVYRYLLSEDHADLQERIRSEGWGAEILGLQKPALGSILM
ncbi:MAG: hypothetical protein KAT15_12920 [Bacteroidales bacterium]|nr:hypothetical protein [Bacteroidales bacterium]